MGQLFLQSLARLELGKKSLRLSKGQLISEQFVPKTV